LSEPHSFETHFFEEMAEFLGPAYLRYSFTKGTEQEVVFLFDALELQPGMRLLDVGCGPGRHALAFARRGIEVVGVDISERFVRMATTAADAEGVSAEFRREDARTLRPADGFGGFDAAISLCQGGFGLVGRAEDGSADGSVLANMARAVVPGGRIAVSAFSAHFVVRHLESTDTFDPATGVNHEVSELRTVAGERRSFDLWTTCFTPPELRLLCSAAGLEVHAMWSVTPGDYARRPPDLDHPEWLVLARLPGENARPSA
jgi:SAM-dependent methyltransferase